MKEKEIERELKDLFENNLKEVIEKIIHPYKNMKDYMKYGNTFLSLDVKKSI